MNQPLSQSYKKSVSGHSTGQLTLRSDLNHRNDCITRYQSVNALWRNTAYSEDSITNTLQKQNAQHGPCKSIGQQQQQQLLLLR